MEEKSLSTFSRLYYRTSLTFKMVLFSITIGVVLIAVTDYYQNRNLKELLEVRHTERFNLLAIQQQQQFDRYIMQYANSGKILASSHRFITYLNSLEATNWSEDVNAQIIYHKRRPAWFPDASLMRAFMHTKYIILMDGNNKVREVYSKSKTIPDIFLRPDSYIFQLSQDDILLTSYNEVPYAVVTINVPGQDGQTLSQLTIATPIDEEFINLSLGINDNSAVIALISRSKSSIIASNNPEILPFGTDVNSLKDRFLIIKKIFYDYGNSDLIFDVGTFLSREHITVESSEIIAKERSQKLMGNLVLIMFFTLCIFLITKNIHRLTRRVADFSKSILDKDYAVAVKGKDEIHVLEESFRILSSEVLHSHESLKTAYTNLKNSQEQIIRQENMASIGQLAAGVAHEINNPMGFISSNLGTLNKYVDKFTEFIGAQAEVLSSIKGDPSVEELQKIRKKLKLDYVMDDVKELISESLDGGERVKLIVQNLKSFSRQDDSECKPADINKCIKSTLNIVWNEVKYKAEVKQEYGNLPLIKCYPQKLNQVFMNFIVNASHAIEDKGEISIRTWDGDSSIHVAIADTGTGIPEDKLEKIFEPFFTTKPDGKGTGLGLSICSEIIHQHNGKISVDSEVGKGTCFTIKIPVIDEENEVSGIEEV